MSDADRLRAAADKLDANIRSVLCATWTAPDDDLFVPPPDDAWVDCGCYDCRHDRGFRDLLRAVADEHPDRCYCYDATDSGDTRCRAALALADVILGGSDD